MSWPDRIRRSIAIVAPLACPAHDCLAASSPAFTAEERQWIVQHPIVRFATDTRLTPIEMEERGEYRGVAAEFLEAVSQRSGLRFRYVPTPDWQGAVQYLLDGRVDMTPNISHMRVPEEARTQLSFTTPYFVSPTLVVTQSDKPVVASLRDFSGKTIAIRAGGAYERILRTNHPEIDLLPVTLPDEGLAAVVAGAADAALGTEVVLSPVLRRKYAGLLGVAGTLDTMPYMSRMAVRRDASLLFSIIQKSLDSLSAEETDRMLERVLDRADYGAPTLMSIARYRAPQLTLMIMFVAVLAAFACFARVARRRAERNDLAKSRFLAVMSHEIRTPMNAVLASVEMLQQSPLDARQHRLAVAASSAAETLLALLDNVLDQSRLDSRLLSLEPMPTDIGMLANGAAEIVRARARAKGLAFDVAVEGVGDDDLLLDPTRMHQVLLNLMSNAVKFTETGSVVLRIRFVAEGATGKLDVSLTDTGIGIAREAQTRLFLAYSQADSSTTRRYGGTGLGLAICKDLVELMGGRIGLESSEGAGTRVNFSIPARRVPRSLSSQAERPRDKTPARQTDGRLLIIEDHPDNRYIIGEQMRDLGVDALIVADSDAALAALEQGAYALIMMDCHMPGMDGYELTQRIRRDEETSGRRHTPIIAISAATDLAHLKRCMVNGMDGVLRKPLRLDELRIMLGVWLSRTRSAHAMNAPTSDSIDTASLYRQAFLDDARTLRAAVMRRDLDIARYRAHRMKGAATMANCFAIAHHAEHVEKLLHPGNSLVPVSDILRVLTQVDSEVARL